MFIETVLPIWFELLFFIVNGWTEIKISNLTLADWKCLIARNAAYLNLEFRFFALGLSINWPRIVRIVF